MYKNIVDICMKSSILDKQLARCGGGPKILKVGHMTPLTLFCNFLLGPLVADLCAEFEVSIFSRS